MKTIKMVLLYLIVVIISYASSCDKDKSVGHKILKIINNTNDTINSYLQYNYPDTAILDVSDPKMQDYAVVVPPNSSQKIVTFSKNRYWEDHIMELNSQNTIVIFIYSPDTLRKYSWDKIQSDYNILRRYDLTVDDLKSMGWTVTYP